VFVYFQGILLPWAISADQADEAKQKGDEPAPTAPQTEQDDDDSELKPTPTES
jgi:hypothetical protein